jgi:hypothetical protein
MLFKLGLEFINEFFVFTRVGDENLRHRSDAPYVKIVLHFTLLHFIYT